MARDTVTLTLEADDALDELTVPAELVDLLGEDDESVPEVIGDIAMLGFAQRIHGAVHHAQGEPDADVVALNDHTMELFEERFGTSFADLTGHSH